MQAKPKRDLKQDLHAGLRIGFLFGVVCSVSSALGWIVAGPAAFQAKVHAGLGVIVFIYLFGGIMGGLLMGFLRPLRSSTVGRFCGGGVGFLPLGFLFVLLTMPKSDWSSLGIMGVFMAFLIGGVLESVTNKPSASDALKR